MRFAPVAVPGALLAGCLLATEPAERLDLSMTLSRADVQADSGVMVRLVAVNPRPYPLTLETMGGCILASRIIAPDGSDFQSSSRHVCPAMLKMVTVPPGDSLVREFLLLPRPWRDGTDWRRWPAGHYQIVGQILGRHAEVLEETEPQTFHLTCHDPAWPEC